VDWLEDLSALRYEGQDARGQLVLRVG
jgi:hypothetical protein